MSLQPQAAPGATPDEGAAASARPQPVGMGRAQPAMRRGAALRRRRRLRVTVAQAVYVLAAVGLGLLVPSISVGATVESRRVIELLVAVGAAFVPFIAIIYSLLFLVVQFSSTTFTPRLNLFRDSPIVWHAFSFFTSVIVFSFTTAFAIGKEAQTTLVVPIVVTVLVLMAIVVFRALQSSAFKSIQLASTLAAVARRGREVVDDVYPEPTTQDPAAPRPTRRGRRRGALAGARSDDTGHRRARPRPLRRTSGRRYRAVRAAGPGNPPAGSCRARPRRRQGRRG